MSLASSTLVPGGKGGDFSALIALLVRSFVEQFVEIGQPPAFGGVAHQMPAGAAPDVADPGLEEESTLAFFPAYLLGRVIAGHGQAP